MRVMRPSLVLLLSLAIIGLAAPAGAAGQMSTASGAPAEGSATGPVSTARAYEFDLYRPGVFSSQRLNRWSFGASVQMMRNIILDVHDRSGVRQKRYTGFVRSHLSSKGIQPVKLAVGWAAALNQFAVPSGFGVISRGNYRTAIHVAAKRMRSDGLPVGLLVRSGTHPWVMTGFTATRDPAAGHFRVTGVWVMGSRFPRKRSVEGYDPAPHTWLSIQSLGRFLTPTKGGIVAVVPKGDGPQPSPRPSPSPTPSSSPGPDRKLVLGVSVYPDQGLDALDGFIESLDPLCQYRVRHRPAS